MILKEKSSNSYKERLCCSQETKKALMVRCRNDYLKHHPEMKKFKLSQEFMLKKVIKFYLESR